MANAKGKVEIRIAAKGEEETRKSLGRVRIAVSNLRSIMSRVGDSGSAGLAGFARGVGGILVSVGKLAAKMGALAITGAAAAGLAAFKRGIDGVRTIAQETVDRVSELGSVAKQVGFGNFGDDAARQLAVFELASKKIVSNFDVDSLKTIRTELSTLRDELLRGDEGAHEKAARYGLRTGDLWEGGDLRRPRESVDLIYALGDAISRLPEDRKVPALKELLGEEEAVTLGPLFEDMKRLRGEMETMSDLVVFPPGFEARVREISAAQRDLEAASLSAKAALTNGYAPAMISGAQGLKDMLVEIRPVIERVGAAVGEFIADITAKVREMIGRMSVEMNGAGSSMLESGLRRALDFVQGLIVSLIARAEELFAFFATGEIRAPWVQSLVDGMRSIRDIIIEIVEILPRFETVVNAIGKAADAIGPLIDRARAAGQMISDVKASASSAGERMGSALGTDGFGAWLNSKTGIAPLLEKIGIYTKGVNDFRAAANSVSAPSPAYRAADFANLGASAAAPSRAVRVDLYAGNEKLLETTAAEGEIERLQRGQRAAARARN